MIFDGQTEKFKLFEDLFHTMIKMQPVMIEQMQVTITTLWAGKGNYKHFAI